MEEKFRPKLPKVQEGRQEGRNRDKSGQGGKRWPIVDKTGQTEIKVTNARQRR